MEQYMNLMFEFSIHVSSLFRLAKDINKGF